MHKYSHKQARVFPCLFSPHFCLSSSPEAPTRYVLEQTQVAGAVHQLLGTPVTNLREGRPHLFRQRLAARLRGLTTPWRAPGERSPVRRK